MRDWFLFGRILCLIVRVGKSTNIKLKLNTLSQFFKLAFGKNKNNRQAISMFINILCAPYTRTLSAWGFSQPAYKT